jgi:DNA-binding transcriptional ArsR family regulator
VTASGELTSIGKALASDARATMVDLLLDGREHTARELANHAEVAPSTASRHLAILVHSGLVTVDDHGRQRLFRLAGSRVATALEALGSLVRAPEPSSLRAVAVRDQLAIARTCYDHLAGRLGVAIADALVERRILRAVDGMLVLTSGATASLTALGIDPSDLRRGRRPAVLACSDWTEARLHVAGSLGSALLRSLVGSGSLRRRRGNRALEVTGQGRVWLRRELGIDAQALELAPSNMARSSGG